MNTNWYIAIPGWDFITWGFSELQERTFNPEDKGNFYHFLNADKVITPEPYRVPAYLRAEISLREAFDVCINDTNDHSDLLDMQFRLSMSEKRKAMDIMRRVKAQFNKPKTIVIQPFGSTANRDKGGIYDDSLRSMPIEMVDYLVHNLSKKYNIIYMGDQRFYPSKTYKPEPDPNLREWAAIIDAADYFIGCDSCGQHMRKSMNKKASVMIAGTNKINTTYNDFHIIERDLPIYPDSMRISSFHAELASRLNEPRIDFTQEEIEKAYQEIIENIEGKSPQVKPVSSKQELTPEPQKKIGGVMYN